MTKINFESNFTNVLNSSRSKLIVDRILRKQLKVVYTKSVPN